MAYWNRDSQDLGMILFLTIMAVFVVVCYQPTAAQDGEPLVTSYSPRAKRQIEVIKTPRPNAQHEKSTITSRLFPDMDDLNCEEKIDEFVDTFGMCELHEKNPPNPLSCKSRCGVELSFSDSLKQCSCDERCIVYDDCCWDFHSACPIEWRESRQKYQRIMHSGFSCAASGQKMISTCLGEPFEKTRFITAPTMPYPSTRPINEYFTDLLEFLMTSYGGSVLDLFTGIVYADFDAYNCNKEEGSTPYNLPLVLSFKWSGENETLDAFFVNSSYTIIPPKVDHLRGCFVKDVVQCISCVPIYLNVLCEDRLLNVSKSFHDTEVMRYAMSNPPTQIYRGCFLFSGTGGAFDLDFQVEKEITIQQRPMESTKETECAYIITFTQLPWKEMCCTDDDKPLDDCELKQCSDGYLLSDDGFCFEPEAVKVLEVSSSDGERSDSESIPPCFCLITHSYLAKLGVGTLGNLDLRSLICEFSVLWKSTAFAANVAKTHSRMAENSAADDHDVMADKEDKEKTENVDDNMECRDGDDCFEDISEIFSSKKSGNKIKSPEVDGLRSESPRHWNILLYTALRNELAQSLKSDCGESYKNATICFQGYSLVKWQGTFDKSACFSISLQTIEVSSYNRAKKSNEMGKWQARLFLAITILKLIRDFNV